MEREIALSKPEGSWLRWTRDPFPGASKSSQFGPKGTILIGHNRAAQIGQSCTGLTEWEKPQSYW